MLLSSTALLRSRVPDSAGPDTADTRANVKGQAFKLLAVRKALVAIRRGPHGYRRPLGKHTPMTQRSHLGGFSETSADGSGY